MALLDAHIQPYSATGTAYLANTAFLKEKTEGDRKKAKIYMAVKQKLFNIYNSVHLALKRSNRCVCFTVLAHGAVPSPQTLFPSLTVMKEVDGQISVL